MFSDVMAKSRNSHDLGSSKLLCVLTTTDLNGSLEKRSEGKFSPSSRGSYSDRVVVFDPRSGLDPGDEKQVRCSCESSLAPSHIFAPLETVVFVCFGAPLRHT